jgi:hypothetical protein
MSFRPKKEDPVLVKALKALYWLPITFAFYSFILLPCTIIDTLGMLLVELSDDMEELCNGLVARIQKRNRKETH